MPNPNKSHLAVAVEMALARFALEASYTRQMEERRALSASYVWKSAYNSLPRPSHGVLAVKPSICKPKDI